MHRTRRERIAQIERHAAAGDWESLYRQHIMYEFAGEARMGFQLAFMRPFCDPAMAAILRDAGRITDSPRKRGYDTAITMYEIITEGLDGPRARRMIAHMNRQHHRYPITQEQLKYVLAAFVVAPTRYIERMGWRPVLEVEREAASHFYERLGALMGIERRHTSYRDACSIFDAYEAEHLRPDASTRELGDRTLDVLSSRLPWPVSKAAGQIFTTQIADRAVASAVGLPDVNPLAATLCRAIVAGRRSVVPHLRAPSRPTFTPGQPAGPYRHGYALEDIEKP